jgi:hypothetical protein
MGDGAVRFVSATELAGEPCFADRDVLNGTTAPAVRADADGYLWVDYGSAVERLRVYGALEPDRKYPLLFLEGDVLTREPGGDWHVTNRHRTISPARRSFLR